MTIVVCRPRAIGLYYFIIRKWWFQLLRRIVVYVLSEDVPVNVVLKSITGRT